MVNEIYAVPAAYDLAFSYRDYAGEVAEMTEWYRATAGVDRSPAFVLELACGPCRYLHEFARKGASCVGIDTSEAMCSYAQTLARSNELPIAIRTADMTEFRLDERFDLVLLMLNSISHVLDVPSLESHFRAVADHLAATGVYIVEASRITPDEKFGESVWQQSGLSGHVSVSWHGERGREIGRIAGTVNGESVDVSDEFPMRRWKTEELLRAARLAGLALQGWYGDFSSDQGDEITESRELKGASELHACFVFARQAPQ